MHTVGCCVHKLARLWDRLHELDAVAERVEDVDAVVAIEWLVINDVVACRSDLLASACTSSTMNAG